MVWVLAIFCLAASTMGLASSDGIGTIITPSIFNKMLNNKDDPSCPAAGFYTYDAFVTAASAQNGFGAVGDFNVRRRDIAAFFGQTSHETSGGRTSPSYSWGYCFKEEENPPKNYCRENKKFPCAAGKSYHGRGPFMISGNANYGLFGEAIGVDLLNNPELLATDPVVSFKVALNIWMDELYHGVMVGTFDTSDWNVTLGYGLTTFFLAGEECMHGKDDRVEDRIGYYKRYCDILDASYGEALDCYNMISTASSESIARF